MEYDVLAAELVFKFGLACSLTSKFFNFPIPLKIFLGLSKTESSDGVVSLVALANCCCIGWLTAEVGGPTLRRSKASAVVLDRS